MSLFDSKEFQQLFERTKSLNGEIESTKEQISEMKRKVDEGDEEEEVAKIKSANTKLKYRISHLQTNLDEEVEKDRRLVTWCGRTSL